MQASLPGMTAAGRALAPLVDHTLLKPEATGEQIDRLCAEALHYGFAAACVNPVWVARCADLLKAGGGVTVASVIGFPLGASTTAIKAREAEAAVADGAGEIDMVLQLGWLRDGRFEAVGADISEVVRAAARPVKVILETGLLSADETRTACRIACDAGAAFVKTATGFLGPGATVADIRLMRAEVGPDVGVKASGGIRTTADAAALVEAGANRLGTSRSVAIVTGAAESGN